MIKNVIPQLNNYLYKSMQTLSIQVFLENIFHVDRSSIVLFQCWVAKESSSGMSISKLGMGHCISKLKFEFDFFVLH